MVIGIDASNLRQGGGLTHLLELISELDPAKHNFKKIIIWSHLNTLKSLKDASWIIKKSPMELNRSVISSFYWQRYKLTESAKESKCDILLVPGGSFSTKFKPIVTMSRNMLPFEWVEAKRYGFALITIRLIILKWLQSKSFRSANGVIFLTNYAKKQVTKVTGELSGKTTIIPHGLNRRFLIKPRRQFPISEYSNERPYQLLYVSIIDQYKHQCHVVDAVTRLKKKGYPIILNLVGPAYPKSLKRLLQKIDNMQSNKHVKYHGPIQYQDLHDIYKESDLGIFASSCENMPNILIEKMAAGLPIACSDLGPMPEILGNAGLYFNPESSDEIFEALEELIVNPDLREEKAQESYRSAMQYSWTDCTIETIKFLEDVVKDYNKSLCVE